MLQRLLQRYYRSAPRVTGTEPVVVEVGYYRFCGRARALVGSDVRLRIGDRKVELAYHPCVGEYLLNGDLYAFRRRLMNEGELQVAKTPSR